jgi:hypothetical protein
MELRRESSQLVDELATKKVVGFGTMGEKPVTLLS